MIACMSVAALLLSGPALLLYTAQNHYASHVIQLALAEKRVEYQRITLDGTLDEDLADLNPYHTVPTLVDRQVKLYETRVILEYLEDRFRQIRLLGDNPAERAEQRQYAWRIEQDWLKFAHILLTHQDTQDANAAAHARMQLHDSLVSLAPLFGYKHWFLRDQFGLCDCLLAPMLWRLPQMGIELNRRLAGPLMAYSQRAFERESFLASL